MKGYENALQGYMPVKSIDHGLVWKKPVTDESLQSVIVSAEQSAQNAGNSAIAAGNSAIEADTSAKLAQRINQQTMNWVNGKFW